MSSKFSFQFYSTLAFFYRPLVFLFLNLTFAASVSSGMNSPNTSANALFLYRNSNFHQQDADPGNLDQDRNGVNIQEAELQFYSDVDPYTRLSLLLSIHPEYEKNKDGLISEKWIIQPEEAFAESNIIPDMTLKIGKFKAAMGKHNQLHTHAFPFILAPLINLNLLGDEGLSDVGFSTAILLPVTNWFSEFTLQYLRGEGTNTEFSSPQPTDGVGVAHWKNLFDLSDSLTLELGASYAQGENLYKKTTSLAGADLTFKWRPTEGGRYKSLLFATEYLQRTQAQTLVENEQGKGFASWLQYQFAERWAASYRYDYLVVKNSFNPANLPNDTVNRHSVGLAYIPTEFSSYHLEYDQKASSLMNPAGETIDKTIFLQANFTIGAHPSHSY